MVAKNSPPDQAVKLARLKNRADFINARSGARSHERAFVLQLIERHGDTDLQLRIGFTVTKKIGNAVERNRIKRRLRAAVSAATLPKACEGHDAVLIARREAMKLPFDVLVDSVNHGLVRGLVQAKGSNKRAHGKPRVAKQA